MTRPSLAATLTIALLGASAADAGPVLRDWALARCVARAADGQPFAADAARSAAALLERDSSDVSAYARVDRLIGRALARPRSGSSGGSYKMLACLDLSHSRELAAITGTR